MFFYPSSFIVTSSSPQTLHQLRLGLLSGWRGHHKHRPPKTLRAKISHPLVSTASRPEFVGGVTTAVWSWGDTLLHCSLSCPQTNLFIHKGDPLFLSLQTKDNQKLNQFPVTSIPLDLALESKRNNLPFTVY